MHYIDLDTWERREYFQHYVGADLPYINVGIHLDVTALVAFAKKNGLSSYLTLIHSAHQVAGSIENFRYRIKEGRPIMCDRLRLSFTHVPQGADLFVNVTLDFADDLLTFHESAKAQMAAQGTDPGFAALIGAYDIIGYSAVPWIQYTHVIRTIARLGADSNPKMTWGKYFRQDDRVLTPFSVQVHHGLMDGLHVGRFLDELQTHIDGLG